MDFRRPTLLLLAALLGIAVLATPAGAGDGPTDRPEADAGFGVVPIRNEGEAPRPAFLLDLVPGVDVSDTALVINDGDEPLAVRLYAADATTLADGSFTLENSREPKDAMGSWIELPFSEATIEPDTALAVPFTVHVPGNAEIGDHSGGIVAIEADADDVVAQDGAALNVLHGIGVRVHGRVAGPSHPSIAVTDLALDVDRGVSSLIGASTSARVTYTIENTGNLRVDATVDVAVDGLGSSVETETRSLIDFLPGASATITEEVDGVWPTGRVTATVTARALDQVDEASTSALLVPWILLAGLIALGILLRRILRRREPGEGNATGPVADGGSSGGDDADLPQRVPQLLAVFVLALTAVVVATPRSASATSGPSLVIDGETQEIGASVQVDGRGWTARELVQLSVCGNRALNGSADCAEQDYAMAAATMDGTFRSTLTVVEPPTPCPCVIKASSAEDGFVAAPIAIAALDHSPPSSRSAVADVGGGLEVVDTSVSKQDGLAALFGASAPRELHLTVRNTSSEPVDTTVLTRWGRGETPTNLVYYGPESQVLGAGAEIDLVVPFTLDPLSIGRYNVAGGLSTPAGFVPFESDTDNVPYGLFAVAVVALQCVLLAIRNRVRRRVRDRVRDEGRDVTDVVDGSNTLEKRECVSVARAFIPSSGLGSPGSLSRTGTSPGVVTGG